MGDILAATQDTSSSDIDWSLLGGVIMFGNGKGGVGKTTLAANTAGLAAKGGIPTLFIDLNAQGNASLDLGIDGKPEDDKGKALYLAVSADVPLEPARGVRPNLDVLPGGEYVGRITSFLSGEMTSQHTAARALLSLARAIEAVADQYGLIVIDTPPENTLLIQLALCAARFVVVPMKTDEASRVGLRLLANELFRITDINPHVVVLGVVVFASSVSASVIRRELRENVAKDLGEAVPVFTAFVRHSEGVGSAARKHRKLVHELEEMSIDKTRRALGVTKTSGTVAEDIDRFVHEVLQLAAAKRIQLTEEGLWP